DVDVEEIGKAIETYVPSNMRSQIIEQNGNKIILDAYNANPTSMAAALESFDLMEAERKIVILGDMFEVGKDAEKEHQEIVNLVEDYGFDKAFLCGKAFSQTKTAAENIVRCEDFEDLKKLVEHENIQDACILI